MKTTQNRTDWTKVAMAGDVNIAFPVEFKQVGVVATAAVRSLDVVDSVLDAEIHAFFAGFKL